MKGRKTALFLILFILLMSFSSVSSVAAGKNIDSYYSQQEDYSQLWSSLSDGARSFLEEVGIDRAEYETLFNISGKRIIDSVIKTVRSEGSVPVRAFLTCAGILLISACAGSFVPEKGTNLFSYISYGASALAIIVPVSSLVTLAASTLRAAFSFEKALLPVLAGLVSVSGKPLTASAYSASLYAFGSTVTYIADSLLLPLCSMLIGAAAVSGLSTAFDCERALTPVRRGITVITGGCATLFAGAAGLKGLLASSADTLAARGVKFLIGSSVPVVGGAISEAYSSVLASLSLVKSTVGVFGIVGMLGVFAVPVVSLAVWSFALGVLGFFSKMLGCERESVLYRSLSGTVSLLLALTSLSFIVFSVTLGAVLRVSAV